MPEASFQQMQQDRRPQEQQARIEMPADPIEEPKVGQTEEMVDEELVSRFDGILEGATIGVAEFCSLCTAAGASSPKTLRELVSLPEKVGGEERDALRTVVELLEAAGAGKDEWGEVDTAAMPAKAVCAYFGWRDSRSAGTRTAADAIAVLEEAGFARKAAKGVVYGDEAGNTIRPKQLLDALADPTAPDGLKSRSLRDCWSKLEAAADRIGKRRIRAAASDALKVYNRRALDEGTLKCPHCGRPIAQEIEF